MHIVLQTICTLLVAYVLVNIIHFIARVEQRRPKPKPAPARPPLPR